MKYLLDTSVLIDVLRNRKKRPEFLERLLLDGHTLSISTVSVAEIYAGIRTGEEFATRDLLQRLPCWPLTADIARQAGTMKSKQAKQGRTLALTDMMIAATALEHGLGLITDNVKDFVSLDLAVLPLPGQDLG